MLQGARCTIYRVQGVLRWIAGSRWARRTNVRGSSTTLAPIDDQGITCLRVQASGFMLQVSGFRARGSEFRVEGLGHHHTRRPDDCVCAHVDRPCERTTNPHVTSK